jgi:magnesium transporter
MQTIIFYNENEVKEQKEFQNLNSEDKIWIDLGDPTDNDLESFVDYFHLDQSAVELVKNKSKKPQIRLLDDHTFTILLDIKYKDQHILHYQYND